MRSCSSPPPSRLSSDMWRHAVLPGQRKRRAGYWWHLSRSGCRLPRPLGECGSICSRGGAASRHRRGHGQTAHGSLQIVGEGAKPSFRLRRLAPRTLRALLSGAITLLACIILISGSGKAALDLGGVSPSLERRQGIGRRVPTTWRSGAARLRSRHHRHCRHSRRRGGADRGCCTCDRLNLGRGHLEANGDSRDWSCLPQQSCC